MRFFTVPAGIVFLFISLSCSQQGFVDENLSMRSNILDTEKEYAVYLPPGYERQRREYPVLYLLHGARDDQTAWIQFGEIQQIADKAIASGDASPMIIIMPNARSGRRGYFNAVDGKWNYEDFFFEEFIPFIEQKYRIRKEREFRAIAGISMGGGGAIMYALHHPEVFGVVCPLSANVGPLSLEQSLSWSKRHYPEAADSLHIAYYYKHSTLQLLDSINTDDIKTIRWFFDCGDDDLLTEGNSLVHIAMYKKGIRHQYRVRDGGHDWGYWRESMPEVLRFVSDRFHR